jgi:hypothetical protein
MDILYNDADVSVQSEREAGMIPHALAAFETPASAPAWAESAFDGRRAYLKTMDDHCNPAEYTQEPWLRACGVEWEEIELQGASHCPFFSRPKEVANYCIPVFEKWAK